MNAICRYVFTLLCFASIAASSACSTTPPISSIPTVLSVPPDQNPDVIWVVREVRGVSIQASADKRTVFGLFACYRAPATQPGPAKCFLAEYTWKPEDLIWPGGLVLRSDGSLVEEPKPTK